MQPVILFDYDHWDIWQVMGLLEAPVWEKGYSQLRYAGRDDICHQLSGHLCSQYI